MCTMSGGLPDACDTEHKRRDLSDETANAGKIYCLCIQVWTLHFQV